MSDSFPVPLVSFPVPSVSFPVPFFESPVFSPACFRLHCGHTADTTVFDNFSALVMADDDGPRGAASPSAGDGEFGATPTLLNCACRRQNLDF
jgi:hypothetical protein